MNELWSELEPDEVVDFFRAHVKEKLQLMNRFNSNELAAEMVRLCNHPLARIRFWQFCEDIGVDIADEKKLHEGMNELHHMITQREKALEVPSQFFQHAASTALLAAVLFMSILKWRRLPLATYIARRKDLLQTTPGGYRKAESLISACHRDSMAPFISRHSVGRMSFAHAPWQVILRHFRRLR